MKNILNLIIRKVNTEGSTQVNHNLLEPPRHILEFMSSNQRKNVWMKPQLTKYFEWVVIYQDQKSDFFNLWIAIFEKGKMSNLIPMHLFQENGVIQILDIKVLGNNRSKGYGEIFLNELFRIIESENIIKVKGLAERPNDPVLIGFYKKFGIEIINDSIYWQA